MLHAANSQKHLSGVMAHLMGSTSKQVLLGPDGKPITAFSDPLTLNLVSLCCLGSTAPSFHLFVCGHHHRERLMSPA
jgi:hypothetical protein